MLACVSQFESEAEQAREDAIESARRFAASLMPDSPAQIHDALNGEALREAVSAAASRASRAWASAAQARSKLLAVEVEAIAAQGRKRADEAEASGKARQFT